MVPHYSPLPPPQTAPSTRYLAHLDEHGGVLDGILGPVDGPFGAEEVLPDEVGHDELGRAHQVIHPSILPGGGCVYYELGHTTRTWPLNSTGQ